MHTLRIQAAIAAAMGVLVLGPCVVKAELCETESSGKPASFYDGDSAGFVYDRLFNDTKHKLTYLKRYVPQGLATWSNYEGKDDMILVSSYDHGDEPGAEKGIVIGYQESSGVEIGRIQIKTFHAGGIAVFEKLGWMFVSGPKINGKHTISRYSLAKVKEAIRDPEGGWSLSSEKDTIVNASSFLTSHGPTDTLWAGYHNPDEKGYMFAYKVKANGDLVKQPREYEVPKKAQGLVVTKDSFIFTTSLGRENRSNIWVVRRDESDSSLDPDRLTCFRAPSMAEGIAVYGNSMLLIFESGARPYSEDKATRNVISTWHRADMKQLEALPPRGGQ